MAVYIADDNAERSIAVQSVDGEVVFGGVGVQGERRGVGFGYVAVEGGEVDFVRPVLAVVVIAADGADVGIVVGFPDEVLEGVGMVVGENRDAVALREACGTVLDFPLSHFGIAVLAVGLPVEYHTVALQVGIGEAVRGGAYGCGEADGVAPFGGAVVGRALGLDRGVVGQSRGKPSDRGMGSNGVDGGVEGGVEGGVVGLSYMMTFCTSMLSFTTKEILSATS